MASPIRMSGLVSGLDTESIVKELMKAQRTKQTKIDKNITKLDWKQEKWKELNTKIYSFYTGPLSKMKMQGNYNTVKATSSDESKVEVTSSGNTPEGNHSILVKSVANSQMVTGDKLNTSVKVSYSTKLSELGLSTASGSSIAITVGKDASEFDITSSSTVGDFVSALQKAGLNASYDTTQNRFFISSKKSGYENAFSIKASSSSADLSKLGLSDITTTPGSNGIVDVTAASNVSIVKPSDAVIVFDGAEMRSTSNTITVNGLNVTVKGVSEGINTVDDSTDDKAANISVTKDTQAVYDMIKGFVKSYNELLKGMNDSYYAETAKGYEPLTDEEKEAMTEDQVKKWEDKIKNSLLRRDSNIETITTSIRTELSKSVKYEGKSYSLASFGIVSPDYTEKGLLHIKGDSEDILTSTDEDKLKKAITENPDAVMETFTQLTEEIYDKMTDQMKSTSLRSALTFYNDKEMKKTMETYKDDLSAMEDRLQDMETRYYKQFTAMETAMSKLNSQSANLVSLLGGGSK